MKRIVYLFLTLFLFIPGVVKAETIKIGTPNYYAVSGHNVDLSIGNVNTIGDYYFTGEFTSGSQTYLTTAIFRYDNLNLCVDNTATIKGTFVTSSTFSGAFINARVHYTSTAGTTTQCTTTFRNEYNAVDFTCIGINATSGDIVMDNITFMPPNANRIGLYNILEVTCGVSANDIISNQNTNSQNEIDAANKNTQDIINNQGENTKKIQENNNMNTDRVIDNQNKNQVETNQKLDETNSQLGKMNDNLTDGNVEVDDSFFSGFESDDYGLTSIITAPLNLIKSITSSTCTPLGFPAPFVNQNITLPCMGAIYEEFFGSFLTIYQTITFGMVAYWVSVKIFFMVKGFKDPESDRIEVLDL